MRFPRCRIQVILVTSYHGCTNVHLLTQLPGFRQRYASASEVHAATQAHRPDAPVRIALLSNPMAQTNWRSVGHDRLVKVMPDPLLCVSTPSLLDIEWGLDHLLLQKHANVLVINGGDGTIHHTLNALFALLDRQKEEFGITIPVPRLLLVNGGGMNMLARVFRTRGHPIKTLRTFIKRAGGRPLGRLKSIHVPLLKLSQDDAIRYGFIFGSELVHNALALYERFGRGYRGLTRFFSELGRAYVLRNEMWEKFGHLIHPPESPLSIDGSHASLYGAFVASTVPMTLALGGVRTFTNHPPPGRLNAVHVTARDPLGIISTIPFLMMGIQGPGYRLSSDVKHASMSGAYTLDGELFSPPDGTFDVSLAHRSIEGVIL